MFYIIWVVIFTALLFVVGAKKITIWWYNQNLTKVDIDLKNIKDNYNYECIISDTNGNRRALDFNEVVKRGLFWEIREKQRLETIIDDVNTMPLKQFYTLLMVNIRDLFYSKIKV